MVLLRSLQPVNSASNKRMHYGGRLIGGPIAECRLGIGEMSPPLSAMYVQ